MDIAFIGLGRMGAPMAAHLLAAGHRLRVHDARREALAALEQQGAHWADSPAEAARDAEITLTCLPGPREVEAVLRGRDGLLHALPDGAAWIDSTTSSLPLLRELAASLAQRGVDVLDAPVSGGPAGAARRALVFWVGGSEAAFARCRPVLANMADEVMHVGPLGSGTVTKLAHNSANFAVQAVLAEAFTLAVKAGMDPLVLFHALRQGSLGRNRPVDRLAEQFLPGRYEPAAFALELAHKDVALAIELARGHGVPTPYAELLLRDMEQALERGWGGRDARVTLSLQQERAGVSFKVDQQDGPGGGT
jgi:3-hydroxyisobutyrate dehydrogenase-like beta-hydroxyacid dehydrogenase